MNLIPESNGLKKVDMSSRIGEKSPIKTTCIIILGIFLFGFLFQTVGDFIGNERISERLNYTKIENKKMEYKTGGSGDYTIVFDGAIGANLYEWDTVCDKIQSELGVKTFVYNRRGYGFNENLEGETPSKQAENLKILLRKAGVSGNIIFVGEEYGSLVATNFIKLYPESVKGLVLVKPFSEEIIKGDEFKKSIKWKYYRSKLEATGTNVGLTRILDQFNLTTEVDGFEEKLPEIANKEFKIHKNQKAYRGAIRDELNNLYTYSENSQVEGLVSGKPLYIISNEDNDPLSKLGTTDNTTIYKTESNSSVISLTDSDIVKNAITSVVKEARKIEKKANAK
ncbi:alpha/beta hydrolase [Clostridium sp. SHJSY1]|uniref:alpha/beta fold hydrolase n=1 Tax=Clostridium sp. SHJSY1 TaxID=2942483 RepID=UPI002876B5B5|nr:alpha/beta hydrolase [Clostridium sp. SHJSY1]MDS0528111.1 alpha/beta hydrolase [Clostridium sp. SHJSY1]